MFFQEHVLSGPLSKAWIMDPCTRVVFKLDAVNYRGSPGFSGFQESITNTVKIPNLTGTAGSISMAFSHTTLCMLADQYLFMKSKEIFCFLHDT